MATVPGFLDRVANERNCSPELVRAIVTDCLAELHEASYKGGLGRGLWGAYYELGPLAAWHYLGLLRQAAEAGEPGELEEYYLRIDPSLKRFRTIIDRWDLELHHERERGEE
jgi:hypothetical protein